MAQSRSYPYTSRHKVGSIGILGAAEKQAANLNCQTNPVAVPIWSLCAKGSTCLPHCPCTDPMIVRVSVKSVILPGPSNVVPFWVWYGVWVGRACMDPEKDVR